MHDPSVGLVTRQYFPCNIVLDIFFCLHNALLVDSTCRALLSLFIPRAVAFAGLEG